MFAALICLTLALTVQALSAPDRLQLWLISGVVAGCAFLTRTNGLIAVAVLVTPFLIPAGQSKRWRNFAVVAAAFFLPLVLWVLYATATTSPLMPRDNYLNLAVAAYGEGPGAWGDQWVPPHFRGIIDVLTYDPARMMSRFVRRLLSLPLTFLHTLTWPPLVALAVPGVVLMLWRRRTSAFLVYLLVVGCITLLSGIVGFEARYHLVLIPLMGAMAGVTFDYFLDRFALKRVLRTFLTSAVLLVVAIMAGKAYAPVLSTLETTAQFEFAEAIPHILQQTEFDARIYARKTNLSFETGRLDRLIADVPTVTLLHRDLCLHLEPDDPAYLYFGTEERRYRNELARDLAAADPLPWLEVIAKGLKTEWTLYRIRLYEPNFSQGQQCPSEPHTG